jgi:o-succinylbenzoate synthase
VTLTTDQGIEAVGEVAPLARFSIESLDDAISQSIELAPKLIGHLPDVTLLHDVPLYPSVRCGFELALARLSIKPPAWLMPIPFGMPDICALIDPHAVSSDSRSTFDGTDTASRPTPLESYVSGLMKRGYTRFKLKVAQGSVEDDIMAIRTVQAALGAVGMIRLDANMRWSFDQAREVVESIDKDRIEFIEEPLDSHSQMQELTGETGVRIALDESLEQFDDEPLDFSMLEWASAVVLKPMLRGGYDRSFLLAKAAAIHNIYSVISSSFESKIGHDALLSLAAAIPGHGLAAGLDTMHYFAKESGAATKAVKAAMRTRVFSTERE